MIIYNNMLNSLRKVVVVDGVRLPFSMANTSLKKEMAVDLSRLTMQGLLNKSALDPKLIDHIIFGTVIQEPKTSNIAREASLNAGIPKNVPSYTVSQACISSNLAICTGAEKILSGNADIVIAGGVETFSDVPIRFSRPIRQRMISSQKAMKKGPLGLLKLLRGLKMKDFSPELPAISNFTTGEIMGVSSDRLSAVFGVSREDMDLFTLRSHQNAAKAHKNSLYAGEIIAYNGNTNENGIKENSTIEKISKLKPVFIKDVGTHTAANSSFLTDGASASLIMSEDKALELGYKPLSYIKDWKFIACDPFEEMLLGPTYATKAILESTGLSMSDIDVFEIHEAFAGQVLSNLTAMNSDSFANKKGWLQKVGEVDVDKMNFRGGSLSLGHPFGATGSRLVTTASRRLQYEDKKFALIAACADGGLGHACVLERYDN